MKTFYNLVDRNDHQYLGAFITSLTPKRIQELENKADDIQHTNSLDAKSDILFELIEKEDTQFQQLHPEEIQI